MAEPATIAVDVATNRHLRGAFAPVQDEIDATDLPVRGTLPGDLEGTYLRNGPNPQFAPIGSYTYPFDGDGMIHAVTFEGGRVSYRNRWVLTRELAAERLAGRALYGGTFTPLDPGPALVGADGEPGPFKNWANTSVVRHLGRLFALWEGGLPYELSSGLATIGECDFHGALPGAMTAHPKIDPVWDELVFFRYDLVAPYLVYGVVGPTGKVTRTEPIDIPDPVMIHDFVATDRHVVFFDSPARFDLDAVTRGEPVLRWDETRGTRIGVMSRDGDDADMVWMPVENCYAMHFLNGYSDGDTVIVDYVYRRRLDLGPTSTPDNAPRLHRAAIDLVAHTVRDELLDERLVEFPRIDDRRTGLRHRYGYLSAVTHGGGGPPGAAFDSLVRFDLNAGTSLEHRFVEGITVGEPVFAPRPDGTAEDDGWILALTYDVTRDASELVVIDAADFAAPPVAIVPIPRRVPAGLHGTWLPA
jgi:carotenoid cleavage dioxygenase-like enzyme